MGTTKISGNVIYYDDFTAIEHKEEQRTGKGGRSKFVNINYTYTVAVILGLCEGKIDGIGRVWRNKDIFTYPSDEIELTLYDGSQHSPWSYTATKHPSKALTYDGLAYMAGVVDLGATSALPNFNFEVRGKLLDTGDGVDVNPADYIQYILEKIGLKDTQIEGLDNFREYCREADILISSPPETGASEAQKIINDIAELAGAYVFWSNDRFKIVPTYDAPVGNWRPEKRVIYDLTEEDFLPQGDRLVKYQRKDTSAAHNQITVEFINRANFYERESVSYEDTKSIEAIGLKAAPAKACHYIYTKERAARYAERLCRASVYGRNLYTFKLDWAFCRLEPGDVVTLSDKSIGIERQPVIINSVTEDKEGTITVTAIGRNPEGYGRAELDIHETDRPYIDFNAAPPDVSKALFIQPPVDLSLDGNEILLGVNVNKSGWGGARVWASDSGTAYKYIGTIYNQARAGELVGKVTSDATSIEIKLYHGELVSGTAEDAERGNTVCWLDGECLSYTTAELLGNGNYKLSGLVRGQYHTTATSHEGGARFCRLDESLMRYRYRDEDIGKKIFVKFTSLNIFGGQEQDLSEVTAFEYTIKPYYIPEVANLTLYTRFRALGQKGIKTYDVVAAFQPPALDAFDEAVSFYKLDGDSEWKYGGSGTNQIAISGAQLGNTYTVRVQVKDKHGHYSEGITKKITVVLRAENPNTPAGFEVRFADRAYFSWGEVTNTDIDFYELRLNDSPGEESGLIGKTNGTTFAGDLTERAGSVLLYAHNPVKGYSAPAVLHYEVAAPAAPERIDARAHIDGIAVEVPPIPPTCKGVNIYIDEGVYFSPAHLSFWPLKAGVHEVAAAYVDIFGEGAKTASTLVTVKATIDPALIDAEALGLDKMNEAIVGIDGKIAASKTAITKTITDEVNGVSSRIAQLGDTINSRITNEIKGVKSDITQLDSGINLRITEQTKNKVDKDKILSEINLSPEAVTINSRLLHVGADTLIDGNIITSKMLQAGAVTAEKMTVDKLSSLSANLGEVTAGTITGVRYQNRTKTAYIDDKEIYGMQIRGGTIDAQTLINAGYVVKNIEVYKMSVAHGELIPIPQGFSESDCVFIYMYEGYGGTSKRFNSTKAAHNDPVGRDVLQELGLYGYFKSNSRGSSRVAYIKNRKITVCSARWDTYGEEDDISVTTGVAECAVLAVRR